MIRTFKTNKFIFLLLIIVFILRLPSLFEPYWYGDEGVYLTLGLAIRRGFLLYRDVFDNKPPLIYLLAAVANGTMFWFRFFLMVSVMTTIYFFYRFCQKILQGQERIAKISTAVLAILTTLRLFEGNIANAEIFMLLPTILALYLAFPILTPAKQPRSPLSKFIVVKFIITGIIFSLGFLFKVPAVFDFLALMIFLILFENGKKLVTLGKREFLLTLGYLLPILATGAFFWVKGVWGVFFRSCFLETFGYLSSWETGSHSLSLSSLLKTDLFLKGFLVLIIFIGVWLKREKLSKLTIFLWLWFTLSLFSSTLSGRPYPHYLIQTIPPLSLAIGLFFTQETKKASLKASLISLAFLGLLFATVIRYHFWSYTTLSYYLNFSRFISGKISKTTYFSYFNPKMSQIYSLAEFVSENTKPEEKIFVWADEPYLYALSRRLPATPYVVAYHIKERNLYQSVADQLSLNKPLLILVDRNDRNFSQLERILEKDYLTVDSTTYFLVFKRRIL